MNLKNCSLTTLKILLPCFFLFLLACGKSKTEDSEKIASQKPVLTIEHSSDGSLNLTWARVADVTYDIYYATESFKHLNTDISTDISTDIGSVANGTSTIKTNFIPITDLIRGTLYYFALGATNSSGTHYSEEVTASFNPNPDYQKIDQRGKPLRIQNLPWDGGTPTKGSESAGTRWSCIKDINKKLVWEVKHNDGVAGTTTDIQAGTHTNIHHKDNGYRWGGLSATGYSANVQENYYDDWTGLVNGSNAESLCGYSQDWQVPDYNQLLALVGVMGTPRIDQHNFPNTLPEDFWSKIPITIGLSETWSYSVNFYSGFNFVKQTYNVYKVRLVHPIQ